VYISLLPRLGSQSQIHTRTGVVYLGYRDNHDQGEYHSVVGPVKSCGSTTQHAIILVNRVSPMTHHRHPPNICVHTLQQGSDHRVKFIPVQELYTLDIETIMIKGNIIRVKGRLRWNPSASAIVVRHPPFLRIHHGAVRDST
jgi:hypothetical protein